MNAVEILGLVAVFIGTFTVVYVVGLGLFNCLDWVSDHRHGVGWVPEPWLARLVLRVCPKLRVDASSGRMWSR